MLDTKLNFADLENTLSSTAMGNLFEGVDGSVGGRFSFKGPIANGLLKKFTLAVQAVGKNQGSTGNSMALLKFKVVTTGPFTPKP